MKLPNAGRIYVTHTGIQMKRINEECINIIGYIDTLEGIWKKGTRQLCAAFPQISHTLS